MVRRTTRAVLAAGAVVATTTVAGTAAHAAASTTLFDPYVATDPGSWPASVAIGDVTGDGRPDVVMTTTYYFDAAHDFSLYVYRQLADGTLDAPVQIATDAAYGSAMDVALADLDGDGDLDAAVSTTVGVRLYRQDAAGLTYQSTVPITDALDVELADVTGDSRADLVVNTRHGVEIWKQTADGPLAQGTLTTSSATEVEVGDVTGDGRQDVVTGQGGTIRVYAQTADGSFAAPAEYASGGTAPWTSVNGLAVGDSDGDGRADVVASVGGNKPNSWVVVRRQLADGTLGAPTAFASYDIPEAIEVADATGDRRPDIVVAHGGWNNVGVYDLTPGTQTVETLYAVPYASHYDVKGLAVGDVSGDGRPDVALADYNNGLVLLRGSAPQAPDTTITSGPSGTVRSTSATFTFTATANGVTYQCALDSTAYTACSSPATYTGLTPGSQHSFSVRALSGGAVDLTPATRQFAVEAQADVSVGLTASPTSAKKGAPLTWTTTVGVAGARATGLTLTQAVPAEVTSVSVRSGDARGTCSLGSSTVTCQLPDLAPTAVWTVTTTGTVTAAKGTATSSTRVTSTSWDPVPGNDSATTSTKVGNGK